uniref:Uncharacterized protein n=2 Tax=Neisseria meningitidis TaxID=487 RepID=I4E8B4_NEIME|nr:hypothetical protein predicted by Glimmer/Critica [Neisseria meningitidis alpha153]CCA45583.1 hypothetical protein NMALPHA522_2042 [Neisseria meningitidis alpha522]
MKKVFIFSPDVVAVSNKNDGQGVLPSGFGVQTAFAANRGIL